MEQHSGHASATAPIHALAQDQSKKTKDLRPLSYNFYEQTLVEGLINVLLPFKVATVLLSGEVNPTK